MNWRAPIDRSHPCWQDYLPLLDTLDSERFPACADLQRLLPPGLETASGRPVRFRPQEELPGADYEEHIHATGEVSTRGGNWHDLGNALVWARLPGIKRALNALHCRESGYHPPGTRGPARDALTLFDECGAIVASADRRLLAALADKDWRSLFGPLRHAWAGTTVVVAGHALLEKCLRPYKSMTANVLLIHVGNDFSAATRERRLRGLDELIAESMLDGGLLTGPGWLAPLPLAGIPGWWPHGPQDVQFYADARVFRPAPEDMTPARVFSARGVL